MTLDYDSHPAELVNGGTVNTAISVKELRNAIPQHCFSPSYKTSLYYLVRDVSFATGAMVIAYKYIPCIESQVLRVLSWAFYGYVQGLIMTGIWVLGHECGHMAFSPSRVLNDTVGFITHSFLLTPYFSWKSSHRRHHIFANNLVKDHNYVPPRSDEYAASLSVKVERLEELTEDSPIFTLFRIVLQQLLGWPLYLLNNVTASAGCLTAKQSDNFMGNSHFNPFGTLFRPEEAHLILASDIGIGSMLALLSVAASFVGWEMVFKLYFQPYLWVNNWIVAITFLHHTHPDMPRFENEAWTFLKGATATVDRSIGWPGRFFLHDIMDYHVIHHLFSRIPFYHAEEATKAIMPLLGTAYHSDKQRSFVGGFWEAFTKCQYVALQDSTVEPKDQVMVFRAGPSPPPEISMGKRAWSMLF